MVTVVPENIAHSWYFEEEKHYMLDSFWKLKYNDSYANNQILIVYYLKAWNLKNFFSYKHSTRLNLRGNGAMPKQMILLKLIEMTSQHPNEKLCRFE